MEWKFSQVVPPDTDGPTEAIPEIRLLTVTNPARIGRQGLIDGRWTVATPAALADFSAVGGAFGRELHRALNVPVGLICTAWGGTRIQAWISREALMHDPHGAKEARCFEEKAYASRSPEDFVNFQDWERRGAPQDRGNEGLKQGWSLPGFDDATWPLMPLPRNWQSHGHPGSGIFWFRRSVTIPPQWAGRDLELRLGRVDKHDDTWVNGERIGGLSWEAGANSWCTPRVYVIPSRLWEKGGSLTIAVRVRSHVNHGGMIGPAEEMRIAPVGGPAEPPITLPGEWRYTIEQDWGVVRPPVQQGVDTPNSPAILFDSRVAPLVPFPLRGAIWYQGEANAFEAANYRRLMPLLIQDWRRAWGQEAFSFLQVQLANFQLPTDQPPQRSEWAELREAQAAALREPQTGMAVAIDLGDPLDIHPRGKEEVGRRLARWALAETYGRGGLPSGPLYAGAVADENRIRIHFCHGTGLRTRDGHLPRQVAIAGPDRVFVWAECVLEGESLIVWHSQIPRPVAVRYAWADNPEGCNLVNAEGLPAAPFRTDTW
jgi:sialate O-acetylesterase